MKSRLIQGIDYYLEGGKFVFTGTYHLKRGYCCNSGCRHCPYKGEASGFKLTITGLPAAPQKVDPENTDPPKREE